MILLFNYWNETRISKTVVKLMLVSVLILVFEGLYNLRIKVINSSYSSGKLKKKRKK